MLSMLASSVYSAADIGSASCLYKLDLTDFDRPRFIEHNYTQRMEALEVGLKSAMEERGVSSGATTSLDAAVANLLICLRKLDGFEELPDAALADITFALTSAFHDCRAAIKNLAADMNVRVAFLEELSEHHEEDYDAALARLLPSLRMARDSARLP